LALTGVLVESRALGDEFIKAVTQALAYTSLLEPQPSILRSLATPTVEFNIKRVSSHHLNDRTTVPLVILSSTTGNS
jgi:hypothetical protein